MGYKKVATLENLWSGEMMARVVDEQKILLIHVNDKVYAYEDRCAHKGVRVSEGRLEGNVLTCRAHDWQYDACTGAGVNPLSACLKRFAVKVENGDIWVDVTPVGPRPAEIKR